jgi:polysaccharide biosynthesis PFTS motif protein
VLIAKPLWAIAAEKSGVEVVLFHYAIGSEPTTGSNPIIQDGIWQLNTWNSAWVVDEQQIAEISLSTAYPPTKFRKVGVPFWGGSGNLKGITELIPIVSVFDTYISANNKFSAGKLDELGWNNRELELEFIKIILEAAEGFKLIIAHKKKRAANDRFTSVREAETSALLKKYPNSYLVIDESVSSDFLISKSSMVISKPVSTTAVAAKLMSIESVFLDPTCRIHHQDLSLRNIEIVNSVEELRAIFAVHFSRV